MKKKDKKSNRSDRGAPPPAAGSGMDSGFYEQPDKEAPLNAYSGRRDSQNRRTSMNTPARRRENNTRTSDVKLLLLMFKILMIPVVLAAAYFGLKIGLDQLSKPTETKTAEWEDQATLMDQGLAAGRIAAGLGDAVSVENFLERAKREQEHLEVAAVLEQRGLDDDAIEQLELALDVMPTSVKAQTKLLGFYMKLERYEEAIPLSGTLLIADSANIDVQKDLLVALHETGRTEPSLLLANRILEENPGDVQAMEVAAYACAVQGRSDDALDLYQHILAREPDHLLALKGAGTMYELRQEWTNALPYYLKLAKLDARPERYRSLALNLARQEEAGKTTIFLGQALGLYGSETLAPWLSDPGFDPVRETREFRALADQIVGAKMRQEIEQLRQREVRSALDEFSGEIVLPTRDDLELLNPRRK